MPVIPEFDQALAIPTPAALPRADPGAASAPGAAIARGGAQMGQAADGLVEWSNRYAEARRQQDAANIGFNASQELSNSQFKWSKVADTEAAQAGFAADYKDIRQRALAATTDPFVQTYVSRQLDQEGIIRGENTRAASFHMEAGARAGDLDTRQSGYAQSIATAPNDMTFAHVLDQARADIAGTAAAGWIPPEQAAVRLSHVLHTAIVLRGETDPNGAQRLLDASKGMMTTRDLQVAVTHLQPLIDKRAAEDAAGAVIDRHYGQGANTPPAPAAAGATAAPALPASAGSGAGALITNEAQNQGVDPVHALTVAKLESDIGAAPDAAANKHTGLFQMGPDEWTAAGGKPEEHADLMAQARIGVAGLKDRQAVANKAINGNAEGWQTYLVHQQGDAGGPALLKADAGTNVIDALAPAYGGDRAKATQAIVDNAGTADMTAGQFRDLWRGRYAKAQAEVTQGGDPHSLDQQTAEVRAATAGQPFEVRQRALSLVTQNFHERNSETAALRGELDGTIKNLVDGYHQGLTDTPIPETQIRSAYRDDPARADELVTKLKVAQGAGLIFKGLRSASPEEESEALAKLAVPGTLEGTKAGVGGTAPAETPELVQQQTRETAQALELLKAKHEALVKDPAGYVASLPEMQTRLKAVDPTKPDTLAAYATASLATQARLGVPDYAQHVLGKAQADATVQKLLTTDPAKGDMGSVLDGLKQQYGETWPRVFGDLQTLGKLPGEWQTLGIMPDATARAQFQRALQAGTIEKVRAAAPEDVAKTIDQGIDGAIAPFRATAAVPGISLNADLIDTMKASVKRLAYSLAADGVLDPLNKAAQAVFGKYDFDGTMRMPKGMKAQVEQATQSVQSSLQAKDLMPQAGSADLTVPQRQEVTLRSAQRGIWVPNETDDGLALAIQRVDGSYERVRRNDGRRVEVKFNALPKPAAAAMAPPDFQVPVLQ